MAQNGDAMTETPSSRLRPRRQTNSQLPLPFENGTSPTNSKHFKTKSHLVEDLIGITLLVLLYLIQGIPIGLISSSLPLILKEKYGYAEVALFSFAVYPYSLKLLWSPIVDSLYFPKIGRRKSWIIPVQVTTGLFLITCSSSFEKWVEQGNIWYLSIVGFMLIMLAATQDIAVDGWGLTLLRKENLSYASVCQSIGLSMGIFISFPLLLGLINGESTDSVVQRLFGVGKGGAVLSLGEFIKYAGYFYMIVTVLIIMKQEKPEKDQGETRIGSSNHGRGKKRKGSAAMSTYKQLFRVLKLPAMLKLTFALLIAKVPFSVHDNVMDLKLLDAGFPKENVAFISVLKIPFSLAGSVVCGRLASGSRPLAPYLKGHLIRILFYIFGILLVYLYANSAVTKNGYKGFYTSMIYINAILYDFAASSLMFVGMGAFFVRVADAAIGGTFLTLVNTLNNFGGTWHRPIVIGLVEKLTIYKDCVLEDGMTKCPVWIDGFYLLSILLLPLALVVHYVLRKVLTHLESLPEEKWRA